MKKIILAIALLGTIAAVDSCVKKEFDAPQFGGDVDPNLSANKTIASLVDEASNLQTGTKSRLLGDSTVAGIVVADDRSGNIYKKLYIQDSTGGLTVMIDKTHLYGEYPVGRKVYLKLGGLYLLNYNGTPELVYGVSADGNSTGIPSALIAKYVVKGRYPNSIAAPELTLFDVFANPQKYVNTLVTLKDMQFDEGSAGKLYSDPYTNTERVLTNCAKLSKIEMYNSSYSTFQAATTPMGNGKITGIITIYRGVPQFVLRDTTDVAFTGPRCQ